MPAHYRREFAVYRGLEDRDIKLAGPTTTTGLVPSGWIPTVATMGTPDAQGAIDRDTEIHATRMHVRTARLKMVMGHQIGTGARDSTNYCAPMICAWIRGVNDTGDPLTTKQKQNVLYELFGSVDKAAATMEGKRVISVGQTTSNSGDPLTAYVIRHKDKWYLPNEYTWECEAQISNVYLNEGEYLFAAVVPNFGLTFKSDDAHELLWGIETDVRYRKQTRADIRSR